MGKIVATLLISVGILLGAKGVLIPFYHYPTKEDREVETLLKLKKRYPSQEIIAVINQSNGTFNFIDPNFVEMISKLHQAGIKTLGYVHTSYANRKKEKVILDILRWERYYKKYGIEGIFIDEVNSSLQSIPYYQELNKVVYDRFQLLALNPGVEVDKKFYSLADIIVSYENSTPPPYCSIKEKSAMLLHTQPKLDEEVKKFFNCFDYLYITEGTLSNPWGHLSGYLDEILKHISLE